MSIFGSFEICNLFAVVILTVILLIKRIWPNRCRLINTEGKSLLPKTPSQSQLFHNHLISDNYTYSEDSWPSAPAGLGSFFQFILGNVEKGLQEVFMIAGKS